MSRHASGAQKNGIATLTYGNRHVDLPVYKATEGPDVVDIRKLYADADVFTYDPGFTSTASCESDITFIDGDKGILLYRGYPIDQLATHSSFLEVCYLLLYRELPAHVLRGALRGVQGQSGVGQSAGHDLHPACRPRTERIDINRAPCRFLGSKSLCLYCGRHRMPVGSCPWRRQRGGAQNAAG